MVARCRNALKGPRNLCLLVTWPISLPCPQPVGRRGSLEEPEEVVEEEGVLSLCLCVSLLSVQEEIEEKLQSCRRPNRHHQAHLLVPAGGGGRSRTFFFGLRHIGSAASEVCENVIDVIVVS